MLLKERSKQFKIIIDEYDQKNDIIITKEDIITWVINNPAIKDYYLIYHDDKDVRHFHLVIVTYKDYICKTILHSLSSEFNCNDKIIQIEVSHDLIHDVRYLTHKDDKTKKQYDDEDVSTNLNSAYADLVENMDINSLDFSTLYTIIRESTTLADVYALIGLKNAKEYRNIIVDLWRLKND